VAILVAQTAGLYTQPDCRHRELLPFPTRRSSDLAAPIKERAVGRDAAQHEHAALAVAWQQHILLMEDAADAGVDRLLAERGGIRSEEHTSELQSPCNIVCRLLLEKKKYKTIFDTQ